MKSKHAKYNSSNPVSKFLVNNFLNQILTTVKSIKFDSFLEVGCGEGMVLNKLKPYLQNKIALAIDIDVNEVKDALKNAHFCTISQASAYALPLRDKSIDLVLCCEVMEHLDNPERALEEIRRVAKIAVIISVPNEPLWCILNMIRGAYWKNYGTPPNHFNRWRPKQIVNLVNQYIPVDDVKIPIPWTLLQCSLKNRM
jgi:ubiquinone/menaquinone biosynthesis C-methylase UbiE